MSQILVSIEENSGCIYPALLRANMAGGSRSKISRCRGAGSGSVSLFSDSQPPSQDFAVIPLIKKQLHSALSALKAEGVVPCDATPSIKVTRTRDASHGDFASNLAIILAKPSGRAPRELAQALIEAMPPVGVIREVVIADPGFINFFQADDALSTVVSTVLEQAGRFGCSDIGRGKQVQIAFVSANHTGPLHVGPGRGAAVGATVSNLLDAMGYEVESEYYVNEAQRQNSRLIDFNDDLEGLGVHYAQWSRERNTAQYVQTAVKRLEAAGHTYVQEGVIWFRSSQFGDEKDRAVIRANGLSTCFASDIALIDNKFQRGYDEVLYIFGSDHHEYTARMLAACEALGHSREKLQFMLIQSTNLNRGGARLQMSTRSGAFVTVRELCDEIGKDAARYFYVMRKHSQPMDFDLDLAKLQSSDNPVYYIQHAHARICSVMRQIQQRNLAFDQAAGLAAAGRLGESAETTLLSALSIYPELLQRAALAHEPHQLTGYLRDLANGLHRYYNAHKVLVDDHELRHARVCLLLAVRQVLANGLSIIGVSTPEVM